MKSTPKFTLVPRIDAYPSVVRFAQSTLGKLAILAVFAVGLKLHGRPWWAEMTAILAATTFWPAQRRALIFVGTSYWLFAHTIFQWKVVHEISERHGVADLINWQIVKPAAMVAALLFCVGFIYLARQKARFAPMRRPIVCLFAIYLALAFVADTNALGGVASVCLWALLIVLTRYVWFLAYSVIYPEVGRTPILQVGQYTPFWYGAATTPNPFPKGAGYLQKIEAKNSEELAVCQLKGLKLLLWAGILAVAYRVLDDATDGAGPGPFRSLGLGVGFQLPAPVTILADSVSGSAHTGYISSLALLWRFASNLFVLSIWGHVVIACCRMTGFKALRNTYRPLQSTSIADFWNRYFFYFKEVLVDVFFYPTFLRYFKRQPRLRLFFATLAAATFGNVFFHYIRDIGLMATLGLRDAALAKQTYIFYALILGVGIGLSQLRQKRRVVELHWLRARILRPAIVMGFYCLLSVFEIEGSATILDRLVFLPTLIGIHLR